jgi:hypothetical protein
MEKEEKTRWISLIPVIILVVVFCMYVMAMVFG